MIKRIRNNIVDALFRASKPAVYPGIIKDLQDSSGPNVCFSVAFNTPWAIDLLLRFWKRNVSDTALVIVDNSSRPEARKQIAEICRGSKVFYVGLPRNWEWNPSRSHGISMNWIYYNIVRKIEPRIFGFIDHDCFPVAPFSLESKILAAKAYGFKRISPRNCGIWNLWAGFTFMRYDAVRDVNLDFKPRQKIGLDTGGGNWPAFYHRFDAGDLSEATHTTSTRSYGSVDLRLNFIDSCFFHIGGASYNDKRLRENYNIRVREYLEETYFHEDPVIGSPEMK